jgi:hypothetical protein
VPTFPYFEGRSVPKPNAFHYLGAGPTLVYVFFLPSASADVNLALSGVKSFLPSASAKIKVRKSLSVKRLARPLTVRLTTSRSETGQIMCCHFVQVLTGEVIVVKNPCMWPGDVRKLTAVDHPELRHHVNTIVFSQKVSFKTDKASSA